MTAINAACPHCSGVRPSHLVPRNYLCGDCQGRATDVLGWTVRFFNGFEARDGVMNATGVAAEHSDDSLCVEVTERSRAYVDGTAYRVIEGRFGGVFLQPLPSSDPPAAEAEPGSGDLEMMWAALATGLAEEIQWLKDGDFLSVDYETGDPTYILYGQIAPEEGGFYAEVVSNQFMPADDWPLDAGYLQQAGWLPPEEDAPNWFRSFTGAEAVAEGFLAAMRHGRGCTDPRRFSWDPAMFPEDLDD